MIHRITGLRDRLLSVLAVALCVVLLAVVASTLKHSISTTVAPQPPKSAPTSGISLLALLFLLLSILLAFLEITLEPPSGQPSGGSILDLVFTILQIIYQHRLAIISIATLLTVVGLLYQYRHHLAVPRILQLPSEVTETAARSSSTAVAGADWPPETEPESVQEAWITMIQRADDIEKPSSQTPAEWQQIAINAGLPADTVETITATFCAIQYGNAPETDARRKHVRAALDNLDDQQGATDE